MSTEATDPLALDGYENRPPRMGFFTDTSVCIGCKACEVACKEWNHVPEDGLVFTGMSYDNTQGLGADTWRHVAFIEQHTPVAGEGPGQHDDMRWLMSSDVCKHCTPAACLDVCPTAWAERALSPYCSRNPRSTVSRQTRSRRPETCRRCGSESASPRSRSAWRASHRSSEREADVARHPRAPGRTEGRLPVVLRTAGAQLTGVEATRHRGLLLRGRTGRRLVPAGRRRAGHGTPRAQYPRQGRRHGRHRRGRGRSRARPRRPVTVREH